MVVELDPLEEVEVDLQKLHVERWAMVVASAQVKRAPHPRLVLEPQNRPEHSTKSLTSAAEKGKVHSPAITQSSLQRDKQGLGEALGKESTPSPSRCSRSAIH